MRGAPEPKILVQQVKDDNRENKQKPFHCVPWDTPNTLRSVSWPRDYWPTAQQVKLAPTPYEILDSSSTDSADFTDQMGRIHRSKNSSVGDKLI